MPRRRRRNRAGRFGIDRGDARAHDSTMPPPEPALVARCEAAETAAFASLIEAAPPALAASLGLVHTRVADSYAVASRALEKRMYNHVFGLGVSEPVSSPDLDTLEHFFERAGSRSCRIALAPSRRATALADALAARGFSPTDTWLRLVREDAAAPRVPAPQGLTVRELRRPDAAAFGTLLLGAFSHPEQVGPWFDRLVGRAHWRIVGAFDGVTLVACGAVFLAGDTAWLGLAATLPSHRRRGAQTALIAQRITIAREAGPRTLAVETTEDSREKPNPSTHNLRRLGFRDFYRRPNWVKVLRED
jgi:GNAT superfamily N-acetyltransferase